MGDNDSRLGVALAYDSHLLVVINLSTAFSLYLAASEKEILGDWIVST